MSLPFTLHTLADLDVLERRIVTASFAYAVRYRVAAEQLLVIAVYHQHRRPDVAGERIS